MAKRNLPSPDVLRQLLRYEPETGKLFWKERPINLFQEGRYPLERIAATWNGKNAGHEALNSHRQHGYLGGHIFRCFVYAHRVAWALNYGEWPKIEIDHINGDRTDNRAANLRLVDRSSQCRNMARRIDNTSGVTGVSWEPRKRRWVTRFTDATGSVVSAGMHVNLADAEAAIRAARAAHGYTERHGE